MNLPLKFSSWTSLLSVIWPVTSVVGGDFPGPKPFSFFHAPWSRILGWPLLRMPKLEQHGVHVRRHSSLPTQLKDYNLSGRMNRKVMKRRAHWALSAQDHLSVRTISSLQQGPTEEGLCLTATWGVILGVDWLASPFWYSEQERCCLLMRPKCPELPPQLHRELLCTCVIQVTVNLLGEPLGHSMPWIQDYRADNIIVQILTALQSTIDSY